MRRMSIKIHPADLRICAPDRIASVSVLFGDELEIFLHDVGHLAYTGRISVNLR
jgi:hypothetical protein